METYAGSGPVWGHTTSITRVSTRQARGTEGERNDSMEEEMRLMTQVDRIQLANKEVAHWGADPAMGMPR